MYQKNKITNQNYFFMAKYIPMDLIKSFSGKVCKHSDTYFASRNGTLYTGKICRRNNAEPTAVQTAQRTRFAQAHAAVKALSTQDRAAYMEAYKSNPGKYTTLNGYIFAQEMAKLSA